MSAPSAVLPTPAAETRAEPLSDRAAFWLAGAYYLVGAVVLMLWLWRDPATRMVAGNYNDTDQFAWFFRYAATSVEHLRVPSLVTTGMNAPQGVNVMWNTFMLLPGTVLAPVTLLAGPQTSLTIVMTIGFAGSALAMYAALRYWGASRPAAVIGGAVYGFSPALLHSAIGHYDLQFAVFLPLVVDAAFRLLTGRTTPVRGGIRLGLVMTAQLMINEEMLFDTALAGLILVLVLLARPGLLSSWRRGWPDSWGGEERSLAACGKHVVGGFAVAGGVVLLLAGYPLWVQFFGPLQQSGSPFTLDYFKNDLSGLVVPSSLMLFHTASSAQAAANFQGQLPEYLAYLGVPLIIVLVLGAAWCWDRPLVRALTVTWVLTEVFSLGGTLLAAGHGYANAKLPWYWLQSLPLIDAVLPDRFSIVADGAAAALLAFIADAAVPAVRAWASRDLPWLAVGRRPAVVVMSCAALAVLPLLPKPLPATAATPLPAGWSAAFADLRLPASAPVLVVPIPQASFTSPLRWQADTGQPDAMVGGYFMGPAWNGHAYIDGNGTAPAGLYLNQLWRMSATSIPTALSAQLPPQGAVDSGTYVGLKAVTDTQMLAQLKAWQAAAVVAVTTPRSPLAQYLEVVLGQPSLVVGDIMAWRSYHPRQSPPPTLGTSAGVGPTP
jgi:hypothetical protein